LSWKLRWYKWLDVTHVLWIHPACHGSSFLGRCAKPFSWYVTCLYMTVRHADTSRSRSLKLTQVSAYVQNPGQKRFFVLPKGSLYLCFAGRYKSSINSLHEDQNTSLCDGNLERSFEKTSRSPLHCCVWWWVSFDFFQRYCYWHYSGTWQVCILNHVTQFQYRI